VTTKTKAFIFLALLAFLDALTPHPDNGNGIDYSCLSKAQEIKGLD
jgi:hypothetical protein